MDISKKVDYIHYGLSILVDQRNIGIEFLDPCKLGNSIIRDINNYTTCILANERCVSIKDLELVYN